jgi:hypothetical protein
LEESLRHGQLRFRVHGQRIVGAPDRVLGSVFAQKMAVLIRALSAADAAVNNRVGYEYFIANLREGSATVEIEERKKRKVRKAVISGVDAFEVCMNSINDGKFEHTRTFGRCVNYVPLLAKGADKDFSYGELWINGHTLLRVDALLEEQAREAVIHTRPTTRGEAPRRWFTGTTQGNFVGHLLEVDFRGALPSGKLVLSAGGKEIDCIFNERDIEQIRSSLKKRVRVGGRVRYDGKSGFPRRIEVHRIEPTKENVDFSQWAGALMPFERDDWEPT